MSKGNKIVIGLLIFVIVGIVTILVLNDKGIIQLCGGCKCETSCPKCEDTKSNTIVNSENKSLVLEQGRAVSNDQFSVVWKSDGSVTVKLGNETKEVATNVTRYYSFKLGQSDMCSGRKLLIFESNNKVISALDMDNLECGGIIKLINGLDSISGYDYLIQKISYVNEFEPYDYHIYEYKDGTEVDLTDIFMTNYNK